MKKYFITFRSVTYAQRAEQVFVKNGIVCTVRRTPRWMEERGCGYGAEVRLAGLREGLAILKREGIPYRKYYAIDRDGKIGEAGNDLS